MHARTQGEVISHSLSQTDTHTYTKRSDLSCTQEVIALTRTPGEVISHAHTYTRRSDHMHMHTLGEVSTHTLGEVSTHTLGEVSTHT